VRTGVPVFLGPTRAGAAGGVLALDQPTDLRAQAGEPLPGTHLAAAVEAFFANGGQRCFVVSLDDGPAEDLRLAELERGLAAVEALDEADLVLSPDVVRRRELPGLPLSETSEAGPMALQQAALVAHCDRVGGRVALLDGFPRATVRQALDQRGAVLQAAGSTGENAALYHPWVVTTDGPMPSTGHVAGVVARTDAATGVHKAPANEALNGVVDLEAAIGAAEQEQLNPAGVNCLRAFPGRGIRVWGARTLAAPPWEFLNVRRLVLTIGRHVQAALADVAFEPHDPVLWARIRREVGAHLEGLFLDGALLGATPADAYFVRCDEETNPPDARDRGTVTVEVGLAAAAPNELVVVWIIHHPGGVQVTAPAPA